MSKSRVGVFKVPYWLVRFGIFTGELGFCWSVTNKFCWSKFVNLRYTLVAKVSLLSVSRLAPFCRLIVPVFFHTHPYDPYILSDTERLIVGTLPPPRFTTGKLNEQDVNFCYGSSNGLLWKIWDKIYDLQLVYANTHYAVEQRKAFLKREKIGICDIVGAAYRDKIDASDLGMQKVELRDLLGILKQRPQIYQLIFTGEIVKTDQNIFFVNS